MAKPKDPAPDAKSKPSTVSNIADKALAQAALEDPTAQKWARRGTLTEKIVGYIERDHTFAVDAHYDLYRQDHGVCRKVDIGWVAATVRNYLDRPGLGMRFMSRYLTDEVEAMLKSGKPRVTIEPPKNKINTRTGILDITDNKVTAHSKDYLTTTQLPIKIDSKALCPRWDRFIVEVFGPDCVQIIWEIIGACMVSNRVVQEGAWLLGFGSNGKSTFVMALVRLIGEENTANVSVAQMSSDVFMGAEVYGKLLAYDLDVVPEQIKDPTILKKIVGADSMRVQRKYEHSFKIRPYCTCLFSGNRAPDSRDSSFGYLRKLFIIPLSTFFGQKVNQDDLLDALSTEEEKSGAFNKAVEGLQRFLARGRFSYPACIQDATDEFREEADSIGQFFDEYVVRAEDSVLNSIDLKNAYNQWAEDNYKRRASANQIGLEVNKKFGKQVVVKRIRDEKHGMDSDGKERKVTVYEGIKLRSDNGN